MPIIERQARFVHGSIMRHIAIMSSSGAIGLMAIFIVDLVDMFFISLLGQISLAAAIGFAGAIVFFSTSVAIGTSIATSALISQAIGAGKFERAKNLVASLVIYSALISVITTVCILLFLDPILHLLGAKGEAALKTKEYLYILLPSSPIMAMGMSLSAVLRAVGDAKRSMMATVAAGIVNAVLDPIFIFALSMEIQGAALASVVARLTIFVIALFVVKVNYDLIKTPKLKHLQTYVNKINTIAFPAILTNCATPFANAIVTAQIAQFGAEFVAGFAVISRIVPVSFALIYSLSGAIGPILGQNFGAKRFDRLHSALIESIKFVTAYCLLISVLLFFAKASLISAFNLSSDAASIVNLFCTFIAITFIFNGTLFVSNAAFNNLNRPTWSTLLNVGKATLGTIPFVYVGAAMAGAKGVLIGQAIGSVIFGILGYVLVKHLIQTLEYE